MEKSYVNLKYVLGGEIYTLASVGVVSTGGSIPFETPMVCVKHSHLSYSGQSVVVERIRMCVDEVSYNLLFTKMKSFEGTATWLDFKEAIGFCGSKYCRCGHRTDPCHTELIPVIPCHTFLQRRTLYYEERLFNTQNV